LILSVIVMVFGGIYYLISFAKGGFKDEAKSWIKAGILGFLIIISAWLIAYTINPYLIIFDLKGLAPFKFLSDLFPPTSPYVSIEIYTEIPLGSLTESLLTRTMDCYAFDANGDPIEGEKIKTDDNRTFYGPTYLDHDRADCLFQLTKAIEAKSKIANKVSQEIANMMLACRCTQGACNASGGGSGGGETCQPTIQQSDCENFAFSQNSCETVTKNCKSNNQNCDLCPPGTKDAIEHGPIDLGEDNSQNGCFTRQYNGLDEFRSKQFHNNYFAIKNYVEIQPPPKYNDRYIYIFNTDGCQICNNSCGQCDPGDSACIKKQQQCESQKAQCRTERNRCLKNNSPWYKLNLIDQLTYLEGKVEEMKQQIQQDMDNLNSASTALSRCYLADASIDFIKKFEQTNKKDTTILVEQTYSDPQTQKLVNPAKYCQGFQYNNSTCYSQCQKVCPGLEKKDLNCYKGIPDCGSKTGEARVSCLKTQAEKAKECYDNRSCDSSATEYNNFSDCMDGCKQNCLDLCSQSCSEEERTACEQKCNNNSQCLLNNEDKCLYSPIKLKNCSGPESCIASCKGDQACVSACNAKYNDPDYIKSCIQNSAALCPYCSDQYAGYPDCLKPNYYQQGEYSSSYICKNQSSQLCQFPNGFLNTNPDDSSSSQDTATCLTQYPETAKCPADSRCPECPCDIVGSDNQSSNPSGGGSQPCTGPGCIIALSGTTGNNVPEQLESTSCNSVPDPNNPNQTNNIDKNAEYRVCAPTCDSYAFNDDPLTFYCSQTWWKKDETKNTEPLATTEVCKKEGEIPVGQTIDAAITWGNSFLNLINNVVQNTDKFVQYIKKIGEEKDYCQCNSQCGGGEATCKSNCIYTPRMEIGVAEDGTPLFSDPSCDAQLSCEGNPCQKLINLLLGKEQGNISTNNKPDSCPKGESQGFEGVDSYYQAIKGSLSATKDFIQKEKRSDVLKSLNYSRQGVTICSTDYSKDTKLLSCTRVENEIIPPIIGTTKPGQVILPKNSTPVASYCYGKELGNVTGNAMSDNWFCCQAK